ncbi:MAG: PD-(D/E)XK nuclease-like domain-containing protein [Alicyclobacillus sp.]|nr:PD-(D/E)XK nuclease-like domain-containing protein [Alicyclobacillus sp.]
MSHSLYKDFLTCEEMAMAKLAGTWQEPQSDALLIGSYVHAALEGAEALEKFKVDNPSLFTNKGTLYAKYEAADAMVHALMEDEFIQFVLQGKSEHIVTTEMFGCRWKAKMDVYNPEAGRIVDIKTARSLHDKVWDAKYGYVTWVEGYGYIRQMALYLEIERIASGRETWLEPLIVAVTKEDPPDKAVISIDTERLQMELDDVAEHMPRILAVRNGLEVPKRCEKCRYCRETKRVDRVIHYMDLLA